MPKVIILTGPTGIGKTALSLKIAERFHLNVINGDAFQVYKDLNITTAKIMPSEQNGIEHLLLDTIDPSTPFSIYDYQKQVRELIAKQPVAFIVGGSGLYLDSVVCDYRFNEEARMNNGLYNNMSNEELWHELQNVNFEKATSIHPNNRKRVERALELAKSHIDEQERSLKDHLLYDTLYLVLEMERDELYDRINKRVDQMVADGLVTEIRTLLPSLGVTASKAIGVKEIKSYLDNEIDLADACALIKQNSRHYAKRQMTWYRHHPNITFISKDTSDDEIFNLINYFLNDN